MSALGCNLTVSVLHWVVNIGWLAMKAPVIAHILNSEPSLLAENMEMCPCTLKDLSDLGVHMHCTLRHFYPIQGSAASTM